ncbi:hypothetical protein CDS [Salmonella enterica subsp. enterica serovar Derby]|nr:hypothetical protein CDS [Salmonella enterica subsp. enterica serovar Derby]
MKLPEVLVVVIAMVDRVVLGALRLQSLLRMKLMLYGKQ